MRRTFVAVAAGATVLLFPASALADEEIVGTSGNNYSASTYTMDQGEPLTFRNTDPLIRHDVVSVAPGTVHSRYLFASDTIGQGTSFVEGSQYLTTGEYEFYCSIHDSEMRAKLVVTAAGTPQQRPSSGGPPPPPDTTAPAPTIKGPSKLSVAKLKKARKLVVTVSSNEASELEINVRIGSKRIAGTKLSMTTPGSQKIEVRLGKTARKSLKKGKTLTAAVSAADANGNQGIARYTKQLGR